MDIGRALTQLFPEGGWGSCGETYESIIWTHPTSKQPSLEELEAVEFKDPPLKSLKESFSALPIETQAAFGPLAAAVFMFLDQGNPEAAKLVIQGAQIPAELEALRAQMLGAF